MQKYIKLVDCPNEWFTVLNYKNWKILKILQISIDSLMQVSVR
jgi:hypothetical protein